MVPKRHKLAAQYALWNLVLGACDGNKAQSVDQQPLFEMSRSDTDDKGQILMMQIGIMIFAVLLVQHHLHGAWSNRRKNSIDPWLACCNQTWAIELYCAETAAAAWSKHFDDTEFCS